MSKYFYMIFLFFSVISFSANLPDNYENNKYYQYILKNTGNDQYSKELYDYINYFSSKYEVEVPLILSIIKIESNFEPLAKSKAGAVGIMQIMPETAKNLNIDPYILEQNLDGGIRYLSECLKSNKDIGLALISYNAGAGNLKKYDGLPPFEETQQYIEKVVKLYNELGDKNYIYNTVLLSNSSELEFDNTVNFFK